MIVAMYIYIYSTEWLFNGADMDQGLFTHHFIIHEGKVLQY